MWEKVFARPGQYLKKHSSNVSAFASNFGSKCGAANLPCVAGFEHDFGKVSPEFQEYLFDENAVRGSVKHSIFSAKQAYNEASEFPPIAEILGNVIAAHHGRLYDNLAPNGDTPLRDKLDGATIFPVLADCLEIDIDTLKSEFYAIITKMPDCEKAFCVSMFTKYIYSCLVDADRLDAYLFESGKNYLPEKPNWNGLLSRLEQNIAKLDSKSKMAALRRQISNACAKAGQRETGVYKLEVPTGGGKTLSSLRFALEHARRHELDRIIYVIPYLSILSQTAKELRDKLDADDEIVIEHHSNFLPDNSENYKLHTDRWDAPIVLTTQVQFLESVFSEKGSDLRKLHNMSRSVLIFDEAQSLPVKCVHLFNGAVNFLHRVCGSTILLCTATQPLLDTVDRPILFSKNPSIADCGQVTKRTHILNAIKPGGYSYPELTAFILEKHTISTLVIVNTKSAAKSLYEELKHSDMPILHLSTNMCSAHREEVIGELRCRLEKNEPVICVSTQLIEAGVDISLECVVRDIAGLDSIFQAEGRCNRHGESDEIKNVYVVNIKGENLNKLPDIKIGAEITRRLFEDGNIDINAYYQHYFYERRMIMDYPASGGGTIYDLLSENKQGQKAYTARKDKHCVTPPSLRSAIRSAADEFFVIEKGRTDIVVPYGKSEELLSQFFSEYDLAKKRKLLRELGKYSVSLYKYQLDELSRRGALNVSKEITTLARGFYDKERGVDLEGSHEFLCV